MSVKITGLPELLNTLENRLGKKKMDAIVDRALTEGGVVFGMELRRQLAKMTPGRGYSKGYTLAEVTITNPREGFWGERQVVVHWTGNHGRYRLIHLNEFGSPQAPRPPGFGLIAQTMERAQGTYREAVASSIRRQI